MIKVAGMALFIIGVILFALGLTYVPSSELLLIGIILGAAGFLLLWWTRR